ncbi:hypothetical protein ACH4PR_51030 [Streptomyces mirabilis]|uniref:hypothetical protein n=1 Tax=Streptomyces mirabilis TaxID=68239 RepID=UPI00378CB5D2
MLLQNAGVQRRQATDALLAGGWIEAIIKSLAQVLKQEKNESWLRVRVLFSIGYLQCRNHTVAQTLMGADPMRVLLIRGWVWPGRGSASGGCG